MIGHDLDPNADHGNPYSRCRSIADIERVLAGLRRRSGLSWSEGVRALSHPGAALLQRHPRVLDLAVHLNRTADLDLLEAVERVAAAAAPQS